jgi:hypothetical protein
VPGFAVYDWRPPAQLDPREPQEIRLLPAGTVVVQVLDEAQLPVPSVEVTCVVAAPDDPRLAAPHVLGRHAQTAEHGVCVIEPVPGRPLCGVDRLVRRVDLAERAGPGRRQEADGGGGFDGREGGGRARVGEERRHVVTGRARPGGAADGGARVAPVARS